MQKQSHRRVRLVILIDSYVVLFTVRSGIYHLFFPPFLHKLFLPFNQTWIVWLLCGSTMMMGANQIKAEKHSVRVLQYANTDDTCVLCSEVCDLYPQLCQGSHQ